MKSQRWNPELRRWLDEASRKAGFDVCGVAAVRGPDDPSAAQQTQRFSAWIDDGHAGEMEYLKRRDEQGTLVRSSLHVALPWVRSVIVCALNYNSAEAPLSIDPAPPGSGWIARYAWTGRLLDDGTCDPTDYHNELLTRLRCIEADLLTRTACTTRGYVDTGPLVERALAAQAGVGWIGKNTCVIHQHLGSWLLLGVIVTSLAVEETCVEEPLESPPTKPPVTLLQKFGTTQNTWLKSASKSLDHCGTCTRCIDACPTGALLGSMSPDAPRTMDASRCIAYLTIEKKGAIDPSLRAQMGRHVFGCDICQDVCPWNSRPHAKPSVEPGAPSIAFFAMGGSSSNSSSIPRPGRNEWESMQPRPELINPALDWLAAMDASQFKRLLKGSPLERTGRKRLLRNAAIAMGNSGEARFLPQLEAWAAGEDAVLADAANWARARLLA